MKDRDEQEYWTEVVQYLKETQKTTPIVLIYSSRDGWANVSYKGEIVNLSSDQSWHHITETVKSLIHDRQPKGPRKTITRWGLHNQG